MYCYNNPLKFVDLDGRFPWVAMGVGAGLDYTLQVVMNFVEGEKSIVENFYKVDPVSIAVSAGTSTTGAGLVLKAEKIIEVIKLGKKASKVAGIATEVAVDATLSASSQAIKDGEVNLESVVIDVAAGQVAGEVASKIKLKKQNNHEGKRNYRQADRANRVARGNARASRNKAAEEATKKAKDYGNKSGTAASNTMSTIYEEVESKKKEK